MAKTDRRRKAAKVAGAALLLYLLLGGGGGRAAARKRQRRGGSQGIRRCRLRLDGSGVLTLNGEPTTLEEAVARCQAGPGEAGIVITGDALYGRAQAVRRAFRDADVPLAEAPSAHRRKRDDHGA